MTKRLHHVEYESLRDRVAVELAVRRAKPNPAARPAANGSPALKALRASLKTASGAERERIARLIARTESLYRPPSLPPPTAKREPKARQYLRAGTIKACAAELLQWRGADGRGMAYDAILGRVLAKFPTVPNGGRKGKPTGFGFKDLERLSAELLERGYNLPPRPRRAKKAAGERSARPVTDTGKPTRANSRQNTAGRASIKRAA
ncbi:MAG TPA: hypothetical protein VL048_05855 [Xanthobacteraceae bacterium]|nr:hypothetical protein [Xanthobacteraceae bacterium]